MSAETLNLRDEVRLATGRLPLFDRRPIGAPWRVPWRKQGSLPWAAAANRVSVSPSAARFDARHLYGAVPIGDGDLTAVAIPDPFTPAACASGPFLA